MTSFFSSDPIVRIAETLIEKPEIETLDDVKRVIDDVASQLMPSQDNMVIPAAAILVGGLGGAGGLPFQIASLAVASGSWSFGQRFVEVNQYRPALREAKAHIGTLDAPVNPHAAVTQLRNVAVRLINRSKAKITVAGGIVLGSETLQRNYTEQGLLIAAGYGVASMLDYARGNRLNRSADVITRSFGISHPESAR